MRGFVRAARGMFNSDKNYRGKERARNASQAPDAQASPVHCIQFVRLRLDQFTARRAAGQPVLLEGHKPS